MKKNVVAMILAGGQGSRLKQLTYDTPKPAVAYGGKYRIIDFALSNCTNSGIDTVGILVQYKPFPLTKYIGIGSAWDLDDEVMGVNILSPHYKTNVGSWFEGTAHAIEQNFDFIEQYDPNNLLILSGDHIYKMDYGKLIECHNQNNADVTIAAIKVPLSEANRFGIIIADQNNAVTGFEEKPQKPKSDLASMGIYVFKWKKFYETINYLKKNNLVYNDFGNDVLPFMLKNKDKIFIYAYQGYWKDVGTIQSLWEANMDLIDHYEELNLNNREWIIFTNNKIRSPQILGPNAKIVKSSISDGCYINGNVNHSVIFSGVRIENKAKVINSVIMGSSVIGANAKIINAVVAENQIIKPNEVFGSLNSEILLYCKGKQDND